MQRFTGVLLVLAATASFIPASQTAQAQSIIFVDDDASPGGNGQTWGTAYKYLQDALTAARGSGGTITQIWVAAGTYKPDRSSANPNGTGDRTATFQLIDGVALVGGLAGNEDPATFDLGTRDFVTNPTILSGDLAGNDGPNFANNGENSYHVLVASGTDATAILDGVTVTAGNANAISPPDYYGGGMYSSGGSPTFTNCTFRWNSASGLAAGDDAYGGGMYNELGNPVLINCTFNGNSAADGGGMCNESSNPTLTNCTFGGNSLRGVSNLGSSNPTLVNCILWGNTAGEISGSATVTYSCVRGGRTGTGNISDNPRLVSIAGGNLRVRHGSPCIDAGNNAAVPAGITTDLAGSPRFVDDLDTQDTGNPGSPPRPVVDMGAYEYRPGAAQRLFVRADAAPGGDGQSWATACRCLQDALIGPQASPWVTEVWVAQGTYKPDQGGYQTAGDRAATFQLIGGVAIRGGFAGDEDPATFDLASRDSVANQTVLSGDLAGNDGPTFPSPNNAENSVHVVTADRTDATGILDGFTITGGNANATGATNDGGGGLYALGGKPTLTGCAFRRNSAVAGGGGIYNSGSGTLTHCAVNENSADAAGGMYNSGKPTLANCTFSGNRGFHRAGGMYSVTGSATLTNCTFSANWSHDIGAGMYNQNSNSALINCTFIGNSASDGGGMSNFASSPTLTNCAFSGNSAGYHGGGMNNDASSSPTLTNCILWGNTAVYCASAQICGSATVTYSCVQGGWTGTGNISVDPRFVSLAGGNLHLRYGSPCIDAGNNAAITVPTDLDDNPRLVDDPNVTDCAYAPGTCGTPPIVDMGPYEYQALTAQVLLVNGGAAPGGNGQTWATAYRYLQDALAYAQTSPAVNEIWAAKGTYKPDQGQNQTSGNRSATFQLISGVALRGGFAGDEDSATFDLATRDLVANETILSGDLAGNDGPNFANNGENSYNVVTGSGAGSNPILDGFTITAGNTGASGGGLYNPGGSPTLSHCKFSMNSASSGGGGMYNSSGSPTLSNCMFTGNSGAGISGGNPTLINCVFSGNSGAGISGGNLTLTNCTFGANSGGGISGASSTLTNCILWGNGTQITGPATVTYSCVQGGWTGTGNISADPRFMSAATGNLRLRRGSPCIDAGNNAAAGLNGITTDLDGNPRKVDDPDSPDTGGGTAPIVDMGAYEYEPVAGRRVFVNAAAPAVGDGQSWATAYHYLQDALVGPHASPGVTEVWVAKGSYKPDQGQNRTVGNRAATFELISGVPIRGGFAGNEDPATFNLVSRDFVANQTILSGDLAGDDGPGFANNGENSYHVVTSSGVNAAAVLDGFTITAGNANANTSPGNYGGGMYNSGGSPTLSNRAFTGNSASSSAGGVYNSGGSPGFTTCTLVGNSATQNGGGIYNSTSSATLTNCTCSGNSANYGGGVYNSGGSPRCGNCAFIGNSATQNGGGMYNSSSSPTLTYCRFNTNSASSSGGGMYNSASSPTLANCTFSGNSGAGISGGNPTLTNCTFGANSGGGISNASSTLTNCILWGNGTQITGSATVTYSCIEGGWTGTGNISADPRLLSIASGNLRLRRGSPCIDASNNAAPGLNAITADLDGNPRKVDDPDTPDTGSGTAPILFGTPLANGV